MSKSTAPTQKENTVEYLLETQNKDIFPKKKDNKLLRNLD